MPPQYKEIMVGDCIFYFSFVLGTLPHKLKVVIAGNHDMTMDLEMVHDRRQYLSRQFSIKEAVSICMSAISISVRQGSNFSHRSASKKQYILSVMATG